MIKIKELSEEMGNETKTDTMSMNKVELVANNLLSNLQLFGLDAKYVLTFGFSKICERNLLRKITVLTKR